MLGSRPHTATSTQRQGEHMKSNIASANGRAAYQGNIVFTKHIAANTDSWQTGMNNNILVLGCSGSGKTRNHLKPNGRKDLRR